MEGWPHCRLCMLRPGAAGGAWSHAARWQRAALAQQSAERYSRHLRVPLGSPAERTSCLQVFPSSAVQYGVYDLAKEALSRNNRGESLSECAESGGSKHRLVVTTADGMVRQPGRPVARKADLFLAACLHEGWLSEQD